MVLQVTSSTLSLVDDGEVFAHVPEVACHESFDDELYVADGFLPFFFVFWSDVLFLSFGKDVVDDFLWHLEFVFELLEGGVCFREFLSVFVYVSEVCVDDDAFGRQFSVAFGVAHGVEWDEVVWHAAHSVTAYCILLHGRSCRAVPVQIGYRFGSCWSP